MSRVVSSQPPRLDPQRIAAVETEVLKLKVPRGLTAFAATEDDVAEMMAMSLAAFGHEALSRADFSRYLRRSHALIFGLRHKGGIAAYCVIELNARQRRIYVVETCTAPAFRGQGHAFWLRTKVDGIAGHLGYRHIASHVRVSNTPALKLNEKVGMSVVARLKGYYEDGEDGFYLKKKLPGAGASGTFFLMPADSVVDNDVGY
jgi:[ribosomal protein S18]-alanine N-acetyltransferase